MYRLTFYKLTNATASAQVDNTALKNAVGTTPPGQHGNTPITTNVDQLITADVDRFCSSLANLYSQLSKPMLDIFIYVYGISSSIGASVPGMMLGYLCVIGFIMVKIRKPMAKLTAMEQQLEGEFRFVNSRIITNAEEIAFYGGSKRELNGILGAFQKLYEHAGAFTDLKFVMDFMENVLAKCMLVF